MPFIKKGQASSSADFTSIPFVNLKSLGLMDKPYKAYKAFAVINFIPLVHLGVDDDGNTTLMANDVNVKYSEHKFTKYSFITPVTDGKPGETKYNVVSWADCGLRKEDGDTYDDPGVTLGLHKAQDDRSNTPGLHGAPDGEYPTIEPYFTEVQIPVLWDVKLENDEVKEDTGTLQWLTLNPSQYRKLQAALETAAEQNRLYTKRANKGKEVDVSDALYLVEFTNDPKAKALAERKLLKGTVPVDMYDTLAEAIETSNKEYPQLVERLEKSVKWYQPILDQLEAGEIEYDEAQTQVIASIARKLMVAWSEIADGANMTDEEIIAAFDAVSTKYSQSKNANLAAAVIDRKRFNVDDDGNEEDDDDRPF